MACERSISQRLEEILNRAREYIRPRKSTKVAYTDMTGMIPSKIARRVSIEEGRPGSKRLFLLHQIVTENGCCPADVVTRRVSSGPRGP